MSTPATKPATEPTLPTATLDKYKAAAGVVENVVKQLLAKAVEGANILELCQEGDKLVEEGVKPLYNKAKGTPKGIAVIVGADGPISGVRANLLAAAFQAGEIALRTVKPGVRNWEVTEAVKALVKEYEASGVKGVEGTLSHQFLQNNLEAKKGLVAFPTASQRGDSDNTYNLEEGEVYGLNILVTDGERSPKAADTARTTIFSKTQSTYSLKMKTSRATFSEISTKAGSFPFTLRIMEDEVRARMGVKECVQHNLVRGYDLLTTEKPENLSAQVFITFTVTKTGAARLSAAPTFYSADKVKSDVELSDKTKETLARPLKAKPQKKKKAAGDKAE
ncbi:hypothetical protein JCM8208_001588 [Rhodotorula glutinis]